MDILVTEVGLKSAGVVPLVGQCVATGMPEHVLKPASKLLRSAQPMSLMGQKRTNLRRPKSTFVRFGPIADKRGCG